MYKIIVSMVKNVNPKEREDLERHFFDSEKIHGFNIINLEKPSKAM